MQKVIPSDRYFFPVSREFGSCGRKVINLSCMFVRFEHYLLGSWLFGVELYHDCIRNGCVVKFLLLLHLHYGKNHC